VRRHRNADPEFAAAEQEAEMDATENIEDALYRAAIGGNVTAMQVWLYNRCPDRWRDRRNLGKLTDPTQRAVALGGVARRPARGLYSLTRLGGEPGVTIRDRRPPIGERGA
jgi:hypothetical protein